jgi:hypothetical protein
MSSAQADITLGNSTTYYQLLNPLGDYLSWSFEGAPPPGWSSNYGGYRDSAYKLDSSYSWRTTGTSGGSYLMDRNVDSSSLSALRGQYVEFSFNFLPYTWNSQGSLNNARAVIIFDSNYYYGMWVKPTQFKWYNVHVNAYVPTSASYVKVRVEGSTSFNAWIDVALLAIRDTSSVSSAKGKLGFNFNLYKNTKEGYASYPGVAFIVPGLFAEAAGGYYIRATKIYIELQPVSSYWDWWRFRTIYYTSQKGKIYIWYCEQSNNKGHAVDPAATDATRNGALAAVGTAVDVAIGFGSALIDPSKLSTRVILGAVATGGSYTAKWLLSLYASNANDREANTEVSSEDYSAHEQWDYPQSYKEYMPNPFVSAASACLEFDYRFKYDTDVKFQIKITASVNWGVPKYYPGNPQVSIGHTDLVDAGWDTITRLVTIYA